MLRSAKSVKRTQLELSLVCQTNWATSENISSEHTFNLYSILFFFSRAKYFRVLAKFLFSFYLGYQRSLFSLWVSKLKHFQTRPNLNPFLLFPHFIICPMFSDFSISFLLERFCTFSTRIFHILSLLSFPRTSSFFGRCSTGHLLIAVLRRLQHTGNKNVFDVSGCAGPVHSLVPPLLPVPLTHDSSR